VAKLHNLLYVDTGSHYRAISLALIKARLQQDNAAGIETYLKALKVDSEIENGESFISINDERPKADDLRSQLVNKTVAKFASIPALRQFLLKYQRNQAQVAQKNNFAGLIMEGRDIGSIIFPNAKLRFFLKADVNTRSQRRAAEGQIDSVLQRDRLDRTRQTAPLTCPNGAIKIDNSKLSLEEVIDILSQHINEKLTPQGS
jgi:cytidylate kinase